MTMTANEPERLALDHLHELTRLWVDELYREYDLDQNDLRLLRLAGEAWDRCQQAREVIDADGAVFLDRFEQPKARPEIAIERDSRLAYARIMRELGLTASDPADSRPPRIPGRYGS